MKKKSGAWRVIVFCLIVILFVFLIFSFLPLKKEGFSTKTVLVKLSIPLGGETTSNIKIFNNENFEDHFQLSFEDLRGVVSLNQNSFSIAPKGEKEIEILFKDEKNEAKVYSGYLVIQGQYEKIKVPIVLSVENPKNSFSIIQKSLPLYEDASPGGKFGIEIKLYYLGAGMPLQNVPAKYWVQDFEDNVLWSNEGDLVVGGSRTEVVQIDSSWEEGDYVFITEIDYQGIKSIAGYLFNVESKKVNFDFSNFKIYFSIVLVFLLILFILFFFFIRTRDKLLMELRKQHSSEIKRNIDYVKGLKKEILKSKKKPVQKKKMIHNLDKAKTKILTELKKKQKKQVIETNRLRKLKKSSLAKNEIHKWKNESYKLSEADKEIKKVMDKGLGQQMKKWKNKGRFLN